MTALPRAAQHAHPADAPAGALKIGRFLKNVFLIYQCGPRRGAADGQAVGPPGESLCKQEACEDQHKVTLYLRTCYSFQYNPTGFF